MCIRDRLRFVLGRTSVSLTSGSLCVINFGFTTFSTLAINLKVSLVFLILVAHGLQTRSDNAAHMTEQFLQGLSYLTEGTNFRMNRTSRYLPSGLSMKFYSIDNNCLDFLHLVSCLSRASSECCLPFGPGKILARCLFTFGSFFR